jgi:hypothetical protein
MRILQREQQHRAKPERQTPLCSGSLALEVAFVERWAKGTQARMPVLLTPRCATGWLQIF